MGRGTRQVLSYMSTSQGYDGLKFTAEQTNSVVEYTIFGGLPNLDVKYSLDGEQWQTWYPNETITLTNVGDSMYVKGNNPNGVGQDGTHYMRFLMSGKIAASGNVNSLLDDSDGSTIDTIPNDYCYYSLFNLCTSLTSAPRLPATTVTVRCYYSMFYGCRNMTKGPSILPAMTTAQQCYQNMFETCTSLTTPPILPATTLGNGCYSYMFSGCTSLTETPELPALVLTQNCYSYMFSGCTSLTKANLSATTIALNCYTNLFYNCSSLKEIKLDYTGDFLYNYFNSWVQGVSSTGDFYYNGSDTTTGISAIPSGWTVHTF